MPNLTELAARCEAADGPDRMLDRDILHALWNGPDQAKWMHLACKPAPAFTASLDAALKLVPEGCDWTIHGGDPNLLDYACIGPISAPGCWMGEVWTGETPTPALALTAASLRALASKENDNAE